jgi:hypothetical protein
MILSFLAATALVAQPAPPAVNKYAIDEPMARPPRARLVWRDEFGGNRLDRSKWDYDTAYNKKGWFNGELQYYSAGRPENIRVAGGRLVITARRERLDPKPYPDWGGQDYTSAKIVTRGKAQWTYGYVRPGLGREIGGAEIETETSLGDVAASGGSAALLARQPCGRSPNMSRWIGSASSTRSCRRASRRYFAG